MSCAPKNSLYTALLLASGIVFFLYANEFKTQTQTLSAGIIKVNTTASKTFFDKKDTESAIFPLKDIEPILQTQIKEELFNYHKTIWAKVTAYTPGKESCGKYADGITSTGSNAWVINGVAVAPTVIPYGSWVYIPDVGYREVDDTGSAMRDSWKKDKIIHIDLRFQSVDQAKKWGVRWLPIHIYNQDNKVEP